MLRLCKAGEDVHFLVYLGGNKAWGRMFISLGGNKAGSHRVVNGWGAAWVVCGWDAVWVVYGCVWLGCCKIQGLYNMFLLTVLGELQCRGRRARQGVCLLNAPITTSQVSSVIQDEGEWMA